ncbi:MAG: hypothetical protein ABIK65_00005, partial [Candidatus Eisenbacteria bacterium]
VLDDIRLRPGSGFFVTRPAGDGPVTPQAIDTLDVRFKPHRRGAFTPAKPPFRRRLLDVVHDYASGGGSSKSASRQAIRALVTEIHA